MGYARPPSFTLLTIKSQVVVNAPSERADTHPLFLSAPIFTLWFCHTGSPETENLARHIAVFLQFFCLVTKKPGPFNHPDCAVNSLNLTKKIRILKLSINQRVTLSTLSVPG